MFNSYPNGNKSNLNLINDRDLLVKNPIIDLRPPNQEVIINWSKTFAKQNR